MFCISDDEGSDEEEQDDEDNDDDNEEEEEEEEEEYESNDDEDYQKVQEENKSSSSTINADKQNGFHFDPSTSNPETVSGLSSMMAKFDFNVNSPFNFGITSTTEVI